MIKIKQFIELLFTKKFISKFVAYSLLIAVFYSFSDFLGIFLLTFIFAYLFLSVAEFLKLKIDSLLSNNCKSKKIKKLITNFLSINFLIILEYIIFI
jgi:predicted PurR-regulated permease PerM